MVRALMAITGITAQAIVTAVRSAFGAARATTAAEMGIYCLDQDTSDSMAIIFGGKHCDLLAPLFTGSSVY